MLPKQFRLPAQVRLHHPYSFRTSLFMLKSAKNELAYSRFGFIVKKTVDKRATSRNEVRRKLRSCIEELRPKIKPGYDMLFFLEKGIMGKTREEMCTEMVALFTAKGLFV